MVSGCVHEPYDDLVLMGWQIGFTGIGLVIRKQKNVIIRNVISRDVLASNGDGIGLNVSYSSRQRHNRY